jgi:hypothetical protein
MTTGVAIAIAIRPFALLAGLPLLWLAKRAIWNRMRPGKMRRILFTELW